MSDLAQDRRDLAKLEARIFKGLSGFIDTVKCIAEINARKLYKVGKPSYDTFEDYCWGRWKIGRAHGYRMIGANAVVEILSPMGDILPTSERQVRPLVGQSPEVVKAAWEAATADTDEPTEEEVREALESLPAEKQVERINRAEARAERDIGRDIRTARINSILGNLDQMERRMLRYLRRDLAAEPDVSEWEEPADQIQAGIDRLRQLVKAAG